MDSTPLVDKILPSRGAATNAKEGFVGQLGESDSEAFPSSPFESPSRRGSNRIKYGGGAKRRRSLMDSSSPTHRVERAQPVFVPPVTNSKRKPILKAKRKKREPTPSEHSLSEAESSDLTPLSSQSHSRSPSVKARPPPPPPNSQPSTSQISQSEVSNAPSTSRKGTLLIGASELNVTAQSWDVASLETNVWVHIDRRARVYEPEDDERSGERFWWPGRITSSNPTDVPLSLSLYGSISPGMGKSIRIQKPSVHNIVSFHDARFDSFAAATVTTSSARGVQASPKKKRKQDHSDIEQKWGNAVELLMAALDGYNESAHDPLPEFDEDDLPDVGLAFTARKSKTQTINRKRKPKSKHAVHAGKEARPAVDENGNVGLRWSPPLVDASLKIPGELVIARDYKNPKTFWPAQLLEYIPPTKTKQKEGKYLLRYLDDVQRAVPRKWFYTAEQDEFGTCDLGAWESSVKDSDNDVHDKDNSDREVTTYTREPSPIPSDPPPTAAAYSELNISAQFAYTKPVLQAILNCRYPPAREKHDRFIGGGSGRKAVADNAGMRGSMAPEEVNKLEKCLTAWCLRDERWAIKLLDDGREDEGSKNAERHTALDGTAPRGADLNGTDVPQISTENIVYSPSGSELPPEEPPSSSFVSTHNGDPIEASNEIEVEGRLFRSEGPFPVLAPASTHPSSPEHMLLDDSANADREHEVRLGYASLLSAYPISVCACNPRLTFVSYQLSTLNTGAEEARGSGIDVEASIGPGVIDEHEAKWKAENAAAVHQSTARQQGCEAYETLSPVEKLDYCLNVLLPESILQILLWRSGDRTSLSLLSEPEEADLHQLGEEKMKETDWVYDVKRLRETKVRLLERKIVKLQKSGTAGKVEETSMHGGTRSRPRKKSGAVL